MHHAASTLGDCRHYFLHHDDVQHGLRQLETAHWEALHPDDQHRFSVKHIA